MLKGVGGLGAGAVVGAYDRGVASGNQVSVDERALPSDTVREYYYDPETEHCPMIAVRSVSQTNLAVVDEDDVWRNLCGDSPGIRHRFTVSGVFQNLNMASLSTSIDDTGCGRASLTPAYTWSGFSHDRVARQNNDRPSNGEELRSEARSRHDEVFQPGEPADMEPYLTAASLAVGVGGLVIGGIGWTIAGAAIGVADYVGLFDEEDPHVHAVTDGEIDVKLDADGPISRYVWADFSVVVPAGMDEEVTFDLVWDAHGEEEYLTTPSGAESVHIPDPGRVVQRVHIPSIDVGQDVSAAETPTFELVEGPVERSVADDGTATVRATPALDDLGTTEWELDTADGDRVTGSGSSISEEYDEDGVYTASFRAPDQSQDTPSGHPYEYGVSVPVPVGSAPFSPDGQPTVAIDGPAETDPGRDVEFTAEASTPNGSITRHEWTVYRSVPGKGRVEHTTESGTTPPKVLSVSPRCGGYTVEVTVWDEADQWNRTSQTLAVTGPDPQPTIEAPAGAQVGESITLEYETADGVTVANQYWSGDVSAGGSAPTVSFDDAGEKTVELFVTTACANSGTTTHTITVGDCQPPTVSVSGPSSTDPDADVTFDASAEGGDDPCGVARHEWSVHRSVAGRGPVEVESQNGEGAPGEYTTALDCGSHRVEVTVWNGIEQSATAEHSISVTGPPPEPTIQAPDAVRVGESFELSPTLGNDVGVDDTVWSGDVDSGAYSPTVSFDSTGEKTVELTVYTACNNVGSTTTTVTVEECPKPGVSLDGPGQADPGESLTFDGQASGCSVVSHEYCLYRDVQGRGPVEVTCESGSGPPGSFEISPNCGGHTVELSVTDASGQTATGQTTLSVSGPPPEPTIQAPDTVRVGESFELSVTLGNDVGVDDTVWSGDVDSGAYSPTVSFDSPGEKTVELTVYTACNNTGSTTTTVTVEACDPPSSVSLDAPSMVDPDDQVTVSASVDADCDDELTYEWTQRHEPFCGDLSDVATESGFGQPDSYTFTADRGYSEVELSVSDAGETVTETIRLTAGQTSSGCYLR